MGEPLSRVKPALISYATLDGIYDAFARRLADSAAAHGMSVHVELLFPRGRRLAGLAKPSVAAAALDAFDGPMLLVDADTVITGPIELPADGWDLAFAPHRAGGRHSVTCGCIGIANTAAARRFVERWKFLCSWPDLHKAIDHQRLVWTRMISEGDYVEIDLSPHVAGRVAINPGTKKEHLL